MSYSVYTDDNGLPITDTQKHLERLESAARMGTELSELCRKVQAAQERFLADRGVSVQKILALPTTERVKLLKNLQTQWTETKDTYLKGAERG